MTEITLERQEWVKVARFLEHVPQLGGKQTMRIEHASGRVVEAEIEDQYYFIIRVNDIPYS